MKAIFCPAAIALACLAGRIIILASLSAASGVKETLR
jgi:hypothetical protein